MTKTMGKVFCESEYDKLEQVVTCKPSFMEIRTVINETQKHFAEENINVSLALKQHQKFVKAMEEHGVTVVELSPNAELPEQVFTRDIGFTIGNQVFVAEMSCGVRQGEEIVLKTWLEENNLPYQDLGGAQIEGGDVIVDRHQVFVGISERTSMTSIEELAKLLGQDYEVIPLPFDSKYLHLDCVFNILSENEALIYPDAFLKHELEFLAERFQLIEVSASEQFTMGTNILSLGGKKVLSLPVNPSVNKQLRDRGYTVIEVDLSEIIKSGGSFRCCSMPIVRKAELDL
ncbi:MAG: dimethylarginine dimethylaminohydrolase family protein [Bacillus sp. (in: firmicutes)]